MPQWIVIENLEIRGAHNPNTFTGPDGATETYTDPASSIYVEFGENITVRNCDLNDNGNGFFAFSSNTIASRNILVLEGNHIHDNGNVGSNFEHNVYVEAIGDHVPVQPSRHACCRAPAATTSRTARPAWSSATTGSSTRTASSTSSHAEDSALVRADPRLPRDPRLRQRDHRASQQRQQRHRATTAATAALPQKFRKGTLYFYNNTVVSDRTDATRLFRMATNDESIDARNNIAYVTAAGGNLQVLDNYGRLTLTQNWFKTGWTPFSRTRPRAASRTTAPSRARHPAS